MDIDVYFENVGKLAALANQDNITIHELIENPGPHAYIVEPSVKFRETLLSGEEENELSSYLLTDVFASQSRRSRLASFAMTFEVKREAAHLRLRAQCQPYHASQPIFRSVPSLFRQIRRKKNGNLDYELLDLTAIDSVSGSEIYSVGSGFTKLIPYLNPGIVNWARKEWPSANTYVRLDADTYFETKPLLALAEATLVPANPRWLPDFSLRKGMKEFAAYELRNLQISEGYGEHWDYHVRHLRRLEVHVQRRKEDYLSMTIEELPRPDDPNRLMVGRCIHLDTKDPAHTPLSEVTMQHLDLAINVYAEEDRSKRFKESLQFGKVQDATFRTHLFRIEAIPFVSLFSFCEMFLQSRVLLSEWLTDLMKR
ncbi:hypothetical protein GCM10008024_30330 [Allgaiera indica]|uniref:Uncharacterized protein n=2 Tax=Allgaiera indica TaxID=765699 RepID=A0AAN4UTP1_9RHOB|nr:hypothetical protein [Allgaiera indica]GHE04180.1 hypothetical protein GCM10008024_30330 [Allgaiera indica]